MSDYTDYTEFSSEKNNDYIINSKEELITRYDEYWKRGVYTVNSDDKGLYKKFEDDKIKQIDYLMASLPFNMDKLNEPSNEISGIIDGELLLTNYNDFTEIQGGMMSLESEIEKSEFEKFIENVKTEKEYVNVPKEMIETMSSKELCKNNRIIGYVINKTNKQIGIINNKMISNKLIDLINEVMMKMEYEYEIKFYYLIKEDGINIINFKFENEGKYEINYEYVKNVEKFMDSYFSFKRLNDEYRKKLEEFRKNYIIPIKEVNKVIEIEKEVKISKIEINKETLTVPFNQIIMDTNASFISKEGQYVSGEDSMYHNLVDDYKFDGKIRGGSTVNIIYNTMSNIAICLSDMSQDNIKHLTEVFKDFVVLCKYIDLEKEQKEDVINFYDLREFYSLSDLKEKSKSFETLYEISNTENIDELKEIKNMIRGYINDNYRIDDNPKNIMKASIIHGNIEKDLGIYVKDSVKFKRALSNVLIGMNLKKRRLSDGIYYYGIIYKVGSIGIVNIVEEYKKRLEEYEMKNK